MNIIASNIIGPWSWNRYQYLSFKYVLMMLSVVVFFLLIHKLISKQPLKFPVDKDLELDHYTLAFKETHNNTKNVSTTTRYIAYLMSGLLIITPMYELIPNLNRYCIYIFIF